MAVILDAFGQITVPSGGSSEVTRTEFVYLQSRVTACENTITAHDTRIAALETAVLPDYIALKQQMIFFHASGWQTFTDDWYCGSWDTEGFPVNWVFGDYGSSGLLLKLN